VWCFQFQMQRWSWRAGRKRGNLRARGRDLGLRSLWRAGRRCRWVVGVACLVGAARGPSVGAACILPGGVVGEAASRLQTAGKVAAGRTWPVVVAVAGMLRRWGLGGRRVAVDGRSRRGTGDIAAWGL
jgi:hypothetical protein